MRFPVPDFSKFGQVSPVNDSPGPDFQKLLRKHKISDAEYERIVGSMGRAPTMSELGVFSAMWSEHCSYKSSRIHLGRFPTEGPNVVVGPGENAGVVRLSGKLCVAFKMESHNHPSYIEPYQGAATGVGGILRDVFCMGARPIANLNALRFGDRSHPRTRHLVENVVRGIGDYGNCIGVPTVAGNIAFDPSYNGNCLVNAMTVGLIHEDQIFKGFASGVGNIVVYVGSATGRDGVHGATMASGSFETATSSERSTVQVGDPFMEKLLLEATLEVLEKGLVVGLQDMGAAGLTSSSFEMAGRAGNGLYMDLDRVPVRTTAMTAYELLLSESQERMLMVITPDNWPELKKVLDRWQLHSAVIGVVTDTGRVQVSYRGMLEVDMPVAPATDAAPKYDRPRKPRDLSHRKPGAEFDQIVRARIRDCGLAETLNLVIADTGSKAGVFSQYDQHIGVKTVLGPVDQGAAVLWPRSTWADPNEPWVGIATAAACNERYCRHSPRSGAAHGVLKAAKAAAAVGGRPLAVTDCLNFGNPEDPHVMWEFSEGVDGISQACRELGIQVVSGNVSLYNETDGVGIAPTPMIGLVAKVEDVRRSPPAVVKEAGTVYLIAGRRSRPTFGASMAAKVLGTGLSEGEIPSLEWSDARQVLEFVASSAVQDAATAIRDVGDGGLLSTLSRMLLPQNRLGATVTLPETVLAACGGSEELAAFGEWNTAFLVVSHNATQLTVGQDTKAQDGVIVTKIGQVTEGRRLEFQGRTLSLDQLDEINRRSIPV